MDYFKIAKNISNSHAEAIREGKTAHFALCDSCYRSTTLIAPKVFNPETYIDISVSCVCGGKYLFEIPVE